MKRAPLLSPVSVVLATYNGAAFLQAQLDSLASQTLLPFELIISDDGSIDDTVTIATAFVDKVPFPVKIFQQKNQLGYAENFLFGARQATGDLIAFCDQDDVWYPTKLGTCVKAMAHDAVALCAHPVDLIDGEGKTIGRLRQDFPGPRNALPLAKTDPWHSFLGMSLVFDRNLLDIFDNSAETRGLDPDDGVSALGHDKWVTFLARHFGGLTLVPMPLAGYRLHAGNASQKDDSLRRRRVQRSRMIGLPAHPGLGRVAIARHRSLLLAKAADRNFGQNLQRKLRTGAKLWSAVSHHEASRLELYANANPIMRLARLARLMNNGGYRDVKYGGMGKRLLLKDLVVGVLRARPVKI